MRCKYPDAEFCGVCYEKRKGRSAGHGARPLRVCDVPLSTEEVFEMAMRRPEATGNGARGANEPDHTFLDWYPHLHERLSETLWEDGKPRRTDTLMIFREHSMWKILIHDRETRMKAWVSSGTWEGVLKALEERLGLGTLEWAPERK